MNSTHHEEVADFRRRAKAWIAANVPRLDEVHASDDSRARAATARALQQKIFDAGFAGITWPKEYGGQELTPAHMHAFADELNGYENPYVMLSVSLGVIGPTLLEIGTEEQKARYLPSLLRGDTLWVQYLSEPSGGSDMAGVLTRATRDGDSWIIDGSKVWTTFGDLADYALCLARTDFRVPKHAGLSMFVVPVDAAGIAVSPLALASGSSDFCQEFLDNVRVPADHLLGTENDGWRVASQLLLHERSALGGGSPYFSAGANAEGDAGVTQELSALLKRSGRSADAVARQLVAELHATSIVGEQLAARIATGIRCGYVTGSAGSLLKLFAADLHLRHSEAAMELAGPEAVAWFDNDEKSRTAAMRWLTRQGVSIMGGTNEIQRNIISERVLGLPREPAPDRDLPFDQVRTNRGMS